MLITDGCIQADTEKPCHRHTSVSQKSRRSGLTSGRPATSNHTGASSSASSTLPKSVRRTNRRNARLRDKLRLKKPSGGTLVSWVDTGISPSLTESRGSVCRESATVFRAVPCDDDQQTVQLCKTAARRTDGRESTTVIGGSAPPAGTTRSGVTPATSAGTSSTETGRRAVGWGWTDE